MGFFTYYTVAIGEVTTSGPVPIDSMFIYRPDKRSEIWRFVFYMVLHAGYDSIMNSVNNYLQTIDFVRIAILTLILFSNNLSVFHIFINIKVSNVKN